MKKFVFYLPFRHDFSVNLLLLHIIPLDDQHDFIENGTADFCGIAKMLKEVGFKGIAVLEIKEMAAFACRTVDCFAVDSWYVYGRANRLP